MKKLVLSAAVISLVSVAALADSSTQRGRPVPQGVPSSFEGLVSIACRDARLIMDAGIMAQIVQRNGKQVLEVSEQSIMGPRPIGSAVVNLVVNRRYSGHTVYVGRNIELNIDMETFSRPGRGDAIEGYSAFIRGKIKNRRLDHDLRCNFFAIAL